MSKQRSEKMNAFLLQLKGDKSFSLFSQVTDVESLSQTWKLCTKVAGHLDQGERLENLSWRLFHLHSVLTSDSASSAHTFEMLSKETGKKLDRERHLRLSQLKAPPLKNIRQPESPMAGVSATIHHPTVVCSLSNPINDRLVDCTTITTSTHINFSPSPTCDLNFKTSSINFESFLASLSPLTFLSTMDYHLSQESCRPPDVGLEKPFPDSADVLKSLNCLVPCDPSDATTEASLDSVPPTGEHQVMLSSHTDWSPKSLEPAMSEQRFLSPWKETGFPTEAQSLAGSLLLESHVDQYNSHETKEPDQVQSKASSEMMDFASNCHLTVPKGTSDFVSAVGLSPETLLLSEYTKTGEKRKRRNPMATRPPTIFGLPDSPERSRGEGGFGEPICFNCNGTQTPLWRRGPNDELLCNACGVFYKVHKKHRPATLSKQRYPNPSVVIANNEVNRASIECTNCNATATPMWRKAPDGSLLCNACALYFKCHKRPRPSNAIKPSLARPVTSRNKMSNAAYSNRSNYPVGLSALTPASYESSFGASDVPGTTFINHFGANLAGAPTSTCNELPKTDFFKSYPTSYYAAPNV